MDDGGVSVMFDHERAVIEAGRRIDAGEGAEHLAVIEIVEPAQGVAFRFRGGDEVSASYSGGFCPTMSGFRRCRV